MNFGSGYRFAFGIQHATLNRSSTRRAVLVSVLRSSYAARDNYRDQDSSCKYYVPSFHINVLTEKVVYPGQIVHPHLRTQNCDEYDMCSRLMALLHALPDTRTI